MNSLRTEHCGWDITIFQTSQGWIFKALAPDSEEPLTNDRAYTQTQKAIAAAQTFVDSAQTRLAFGSWLDGLQESRRISQQEYVQAVGLLAQLTKLSSSD